MSPATRALLGLPALDAWKAARVQAQQAHLCSQPRPAWPAGCTHLQGLQPMTHLDDAIARELAHPAGGMADPLTDSLADQACTQPAPLRAGWENETAAVPLPVWFYALFLCVGIAASAVFFPIKAGQPLQAMASSAAAASGAR